MTRSSVMIQITPESKPSTPSWRGEMEIIGASHPGDYQSREATSTATKLILLGGFILATLAF